MKKKFWKCFIILLIIPLIIMAVCYGVVKILNARLIKASRAYVEVDRDIVLPWQKKALSTIHFDLEGYKKNKKVGKATIVLIIDNSGSMGAGRGSRFEIAREVIGNFIDNFSASQETRMGVIFFDTDVTHQVPLTTDYQDLKNKMFSFISSGGGTNFLPPLQKAYQWLEPAILSKSWQNNFVIFLTDGGADASAPNQFYKEKLLKNAVILFCIGVGRGALYENLANILRDDDGNVPPNRVLTCDDPIKLQVVYDRVGEEIGNVIGKQGEMAIPFAHRSFSWIESDSSRKPEEQSKPGTFLLPPKDQTKISLLTLPILFARKYIYHIPVKTRTFGILKPLYQKVPLTFYDVDGNKIALKSERIPYILSVTWWMLFWLYLPALLFLLGWLFLRKKKPALDLFPGDIVLAGERSRMPGVLPKQHIPEKSKIQWMPSLVIGLGRTGRHTLTHLKQNINDLMTSSENEKNVKLLAIDVASEEVFGAHPDRVPGTVVTLDRENEIYIPEEHLRNVKAVVDDYKDKPKIDIHDPFTSLDLQEYAKLPEGVLGLSSGTDRHAALARAYLIKELELDDKSLLVQKLKDLVAQLKEQAQQSQFMQIIIAGNSNGGVGSGLITDMTVLLRRLTDKMVENTNSVEINLVLVDDRSQFSEPRQVPIQNRVLLDELDCISQAGRVYQPYPLVRNHIKDSEGILKGTLKEKPHNNIYTFVLPTNEPEYDLYPQAADGLFFFIERTARIETQQFIESTRKQEGESRKKHKIESFNHMKSTCIMYPTQLVKEYLKILFISDMFSEKIALKGLESGKDSLAIEPHGSVPDLYEHPCTRQLYERELRIYARSIWPYLLENREPPDPLQPVEDTEQFLYFLQKSFSILLNEGIFSLTGLDRVIHTLENQFNEILVRLRENKSPVPAVPEIENVIKCLSAVKENLQWWISQLLGPKDSTGKDIEGLLPYIRKQRTYFEGIKQELLKMQRSRVVLGIDEQTPAGYHIDNLREQWIAWWLNLENTTEIYDHLKKRCLWSVNPQNLLEPEITFEFLGTKRYLFTSRSELTENIVKETNEMGDQFSAKLKEFTIMNLLADYESSSKDNNYTTANLARQFHQAAQSPNLFYIHLFPHHSRIRLSPGEEKYINRLKKELDNLKYAYEIFLYPPSSNQYRIYSLQVSYLLTGNYKKPWHQFKPVHLPELLKKANHLSIEKIYDFYCEKEVPYYYLLFYNRDYFKLFSQLWLAGKIFQDDYDRLWKCEIHGKKHKLTFIDGEELIDAAVYFVLSDHLPFAAFKASELVSSIPPGALRPDKKRQKQLEAEVRESNTFYCWMKLYLEGEE
ncbi:MAG: VWA domain-containing protein [Candidatus Aminicenantes bacterium]|nr:MAG: VWA domain-containing protein [Candidatus Aminicenantes bacterium]